MNETLLYSDSRRAVTSHGTYFTVRPFELQRRSRMPVNEDRLRKIRAAQRYGWPVPDEEPVFAEDPRLPVLSAEEFETTVREMLSRSVPVDSDYGWEFQVPRDAIPSYWLGSGFEDWVRAQSPKFDEVFSARVRGTEDYISNVWEQPPPEWGLLPPDVRNYPFAENLRVRIAEAQLRGEAAAAAHKRELAAYFGIKLEE